MIANTGYEVLIAAIVAAFTAQFLKMAFYLATNKRFNFKILTETGGMPSSHSAFVIAMATSVGIINEPNSVEFAIALCSAFVVMYDAAGLRRSAGKMAAVLNKIVDEVYSSKPTRPGERLIELLGHTPKEVIMGALLGITVAFGLHYILDVVYFPF